MAKDYISRDEMIEQIKEKIVLLAPEFSKGLAAAIKIAANIKGANVVEVLRCAQCKYYNNKIDATIGGLCTNNLIVVKDDDFCSRGMPSTDMKAGTMMNFGQAIEVLKHGGRMRRVGWNGKTQYIEIADNVSYVNSRGTIVNVEHQALGNRAIAFVGTSGVQLGWLASQADILANDWVEYKG